MIQQTLNFQIRENVIYLSGELCFAMVSQALKQMQQLMNERSIHTLDLEQVTRCDTAGLALLLEWLYQAKKSGKQIRCANISQPILNYAAIHHITDLLNHHAM